jgi:hydrogenase nickel incorporation protein HypA/HybF
MHELALCQAIMGSVTRYAGDAPVDRVTVRIGHFRQVVPDSLLFSWGLLTAGTDLDGCGLVIDHVPAVVDCHACGRRTTLGAPILLCQSCDSSDVALVSGEEFLISSIERRTQVS